MYDDLAPGDLALLDTGEVVRVTDVAEAPETLFVYGEGDDLHVTDRSFVKEVYLGA